MRGHPAEGSRALRTSETTSARRVSYGRPRSAACRTAQATSHTTTARIVLPDSGPTRSLHASQSLTRVLASARVGLIQAMCSFHSMPNSCQSLVLGLASSCDLELSGPLARYQG